ncbi:1-hydroxycarotenoid 3,4-desaturase CrtD [Aestuariicoccus sp. MJ-SS9]|uniref:1-hydroxycarotenoid 3,4-desaturase CrtD n=1 Tax=Aestuariicoccus sp. MJ-SS9 TaxID=3079855 RepID=UPI00290CD16F|nr:1-hydroxycarotenoid 3,4-desaturase CrtD [Aestuariicoccus sp. MJ-SS9]MDU8910933.1 FAD-dependent oxidoreductase [Aestuariicoccus sp. MJ-SS9]
MKPRVPAPQHRRTGPVVVIGAGIGGLCAALPLAHAGARVTVLDRHAAPGGKMRQVPSAAGGVDAGPTVLTLRHVFDRLFAEAGEDLASHVTLYPQDILARHWWPDSGPLDLYADHARSSEAIGDFAGARARKEFEAFSARAQTLFDGFRAPVIEAPEADLLTLSKHVLAQPHLIRAMAPMSSLAGLLDRSFRDPRLRQLFGRYATYVGGSPYRSPALLSLIWQAEAAGVWVVKGGMHALARAIAALIEARGGLFRYNSHATRILIDSEGVTGVALSDGSVLPARHVVFNGDPRALALGQLGDGAAAIAPQTAHKPRSLSANVWAFAAQAKGPGLVHHNVFFCADPAREFRDLDQGRIPDDPTLYLCAEDRGQPDPAPETERFEIIMNAPPLTRRLPEPEDFQTCHTRTFRTLERFGTTFSPEPQKAALTTPQGFDALFPASAGSLYGQSPHGMTAALDRPTAQTPVPGLAICGGGAHPGAGVPMAAISGRHAAAAILRDRTSTSTSRRMATPGGTSTASAIVAPAPSRSSGS